jgi:long-subunit acyl-CoA synthetase (AMP-forming)
VKAFCRYLPLESFPTEITTLYFSQVNKIMKENYCFDVDESFAGSLILHTSGTTGTPKCIELTEEMYLYIIKDLNMSWKVRSEHSCLFIIPLYHIYALTSLFHGLYAGIESILEWERMSEVMQWMLVCRMNGECVIDVEVDIIRK